MFNYSPFQLAWLTALKSGSFKQGRERLTTRLNGIDLHCCLGVACVVHNQLFPQSPLTVSEHGFVVQYNREVCFLPYQVTGELGLRSYNGHFSTVVELEGRSYFSLAEMNDACYSFAEIAAYIESNPEKIFTNNLK